MTVKLFLDDERFPPGEASDWAVVRSFDEAVRWVEQNGFPGFVSFDNDLGGESQEGWRFAQWLIDHDLTYASMPTGFRFTVHSQNPVRRKDIEDRLNGYLVYRSRVGDHGEGGPS